MSGAGSHAFDLSGRTALVTGAGRGIGLAIARGLADMGARVLLNGRDADQLKHEAALLCETEKDAFVLPFDIREIERVKEAFQTIEDRFGGLDILVNNVGLRDRRPIDAFSLDDVRALLDANVVAAFELSRLAAPPMRTKGRGRIINITSIAGHIARSGDAIYTASKAALTGLTRAMAAELGPDGITVNAIAPGYIATETNAAMSVDPDIAKHLKNRTALGRWAIPEELAGAAIFLASDAASYVTGHVLKVDGGYTAHF